jgi:hypothetical protein
LKDIFWSFPKLCMGFAHLVSAGMNALLIVFVT